MTGITASTVSGWAAFVVVAATDGRFEFVGEMHYTTVASVHVVDRNSNQLD